MTSPGSSSTSQQPLAKKRKVSKDDVVDEYIIQSLKSIEERRAQRKVGEDDEDELFGRQVAVTLRRLASLSRPKAMVKLRIQQILVDAEFPDEPQASNSRILGNSL